MAVSTLLASATPASAVPSDSVPSTTARSVIDSIVAHRIPAGWYPDRENPAQRRWGACVDSRAKLSMKR